MAKAPKASKPRKPKVYGAEIDGLNEWIVAAPNRPAALEAFGVNQDLFAQDLAWDEKDPGKVEAALGAPGEALRRPKGSKAAFARPSGATDWSAAEPKGARRKPARPDRKPLDRAEAELKRIEQRHDETVREIADERRRLDEREAREAEDHKADLARAETAVAEAEDSYRRAGGR